MQARSFAIALSIAVAAGLNLSAYAGPNDFFGSQLGSGPDPSTTHSGDGAAAPSTPALGSSAPSGPPAGDYTVDEKRVQKKYKDNVKRAQKLIQKGESMMKSADDKTSKKGRVLKEIGEKAVAELKANNPFPELAARDDAKKKLH
jgi:hypothetical protein